MLEGDRLQCNSHKFSELEKGNLEQQETGILKLEGTIILAYSSGARLVLSYGEE